MGILLVLLRSKVTWIAVALAAVFTLFGIQQARISYLKHEVESTRKQLDEAKAEIKQSNVLVGKWQEAFKRSQDISADQEAKINGLEVESAKRTKDARAAMVEARKQKVIADGMAKKLMTMEVSKNECQAFRQLVDVARTGGLR